MMTRARRPMWILVVFALTAAACGGGEPSSKAPDRSTTTTLIAPGGTATEPDGSGARGPTDTSDGVSSGRVLLGAYVAPRGEFGDQARREAVLAHESEIGRPLALVNEFFSFDKPWALDRLRWHLESGRALMISWNGAPARSILSGEMDSLISERARWTRELDSPVIIRFFWEPDAAKGARWGYHDDPSLYGQVWRHVRDIFSQEGADQVLWAWTPTTFHFADGSAPEFYPGDDVVDLIGADGYLWVPCRGEDFRSAAQEYGDFLTWARGRGKPLMVAEWGAGEDPATNSKSRFIESMAEMVREVPEIVAVVAFDSPDPEDRGCDFEIDSSGPALAAYREFASSPLMNATPALVDQLLEDTRGG